MSSEITPVKPKLRPKLKRMKRLALQNADKMQQYLACGDGENPSMVDYLKEQFFSEDEILTGVKTDKEGNIVQEIYKPKVSVKEKTNIAAFFAREAAQRQQVLKAAGLTKKAPGEGTSGPQTVVNIQLRPDLPLEERIRLIQAEVSGIPRITPQELPKPSEVLEVQRVPENAPAASTTSRDGDA